MSCADNSSYISALGLGCAQHKRLVCTNLRSIGLSPNQVEEILVNCPASCNVSPCKEDDKRHGELHSIAQNISDGDVHSASPGTKKTTHLRAISKMSRNLNEFGACFPGWDPSCQDDSSYLSPIGLGCTGFQAMGCDVFSKVGFTAEEVKELKSRCPCSCQEACPSPTALPSSTPSTASPTPAPTISPSWHPTSSPTATPTRIPSPYPTRTRPTPMPVSSPIPTNEPTVSQQPSVSFAPTPSPTTSSQLNRLPNKPIGASNGSAGGALIDQNNGNGLDFSIHQLVIICVSFCAFVAFGIALFLSVKRNSQKWKERREKRMNARRKRLQATKKKVRRKLSTFQKSRRGVFASSDEFSANNKRKNKKKTYTTKRVGSMRGLALPTRKQNVRGPSSYRLSYRQDSFDSSDSSNSRHRQERRPKSRRDTHSRSRKQKKANVYKGAEFLKPVSRGGKKDLCMAAIDKVDSAINEKFSREYMYEVESQSDLSGDEGAYTSAEKSHRVTDRTLSGDDRTKINQKRRGMMGELAAGVADDLTIIFKDAADDLTLIFK